MQAYFDFAKFIGWSSFENTAFTRGVNFGGAEFIGKTNFEGEGPGKTNFDFAEFIGNRSFSPHAWIRSSFTGITIRNRTCSSA